MVGGINKSEWNNDMIRINLIDTYVYMWVDVVTVAVT